MPNVEVNGITVTLDAADVAIGVVVGRGCATGPSAESLTAAVDKAIEEAKARTEEDTITQPVRNMLRFGRYKPTGRGKPASEYLLKAARNDKFPRINNLVDLNNLVSLRSLLPISLIDLTRADADRFTVRRGREEEEYVFNSAGQTIALADLLLVARGANDAPCANPVKDSMATKLDEQATDVMAILYAPSAGLPDRWLENAVTQFTQGLTEWSGAKSAQSALLGG
ncbi:MAG: phenylalanine--tRNA ligase beta subunit-related protein [Myxococcota bacterium]